MKLCAPMAQNPDTHDVRCDEDVIGDARSMSDVVAAPQHDVVTDFDEVLEHVVLEHP